MRTRPIAAICVHAIAAAVVPLACGSPQPSAPPVYGTPDAAGSDANAPPDDASTDAGGDTGSDALLDQSDPEAGGDDAPAPDASDIDAVADDAAADAACPDCVVQASVACAPTEAACAPKAVDTTLYASYRKDFYYPHYQEGDVLNPIPAPTAGGRFNITGVAQQGGKVTSVRIDGQPSADLLAAQKLDWLHVYPLDLTAGEPFWVSFHSRQAGWDSAQSAQIAVETDQGAGFTGTFPVSRVQAPLKYVGFADDYKTMILHVEPRIAGSVELAGILVDGRDVTASACVPDKTLAGGVSHLITVPLCEARAPGDPWTVTLLFDSLPPTTAGGRVLRSFFPIETWQQESECPYPIYNTALFEDHVAHGFDTFFTRPDTPTGACAGYGQSATIFDLVGPQAALHDYRTIVTMEHESHFLPYPDVSRIVAAFHADECDNELLDNGYPKPETRARLARRTWETWPDLPTYIGGSRLRYNGAFSGATDIQGFDYYVAACAPHITVAGTHPPLRGAFDMLLGVHENHMPLTSWFYTQGLHDGSWNVNVGGIKIYRQPNPAEFRIQALSVIMAGAKGLMTFQTDQDLHALFPETWAEMGAVNRDMRGLRPHLLESDIYRIVQQDGSFIASILRARKLMAVVVFNLATTAQPTELQCITGQNVHWILADNAPTLTVDVPPDFQVEKIVELRNGQFGSVDHQVDGRNITFPSLAMSQANAGRILLLLADSALEAEMQARMSY